MLNPITREGKKALPLEPPPAEAGEWLLCQVCVSTHPSCSSQKPRSMSQQAEGQRSVYFGMPLFLFYFSQHWVFFWSALHMGFGEACGGNANTSNSCPFRLHKVDSCLPCCEWHGFLVMLLHTEPRRHTNTQDTRFRNIPSDTVSALFLVELLSMAFPLGMHLVHFVS